MAIKENTVVMYNGEPRVIYEEINSGEFRLLGERWSVMKESLTEMSEPISFETYEGLVEYYNKLFFEWRKGQTCFNMLFYTRPDLSEKIRTTKLDPFYSDEKVPAFLEWAEENWQSVEYEFQGEPDLLCDGCGAALGQPHDPSIGCNDSDR